MALQDETGSASGVEGSAAATSPPATHFRVINALNGCEIKLDNDKLKVSLRIYDNTTLEWLLPRVSEALEYPASHVRLTVGSTTVKYIHRISERKETRLVDLNQPPDRCGRHLIIQAMKLQRPKSFLTSSSCLCDFGGCCMQCMVPSSVYCIGCGNNGCCRSQNCGHKCCEEGRQPLNDHCSFRGCKPWWRDNLADAQSMTRGVLRREKSTAP